ncbi:SWIM zinc finger domain-containing protein [Nostoc flagelliforme FACHB-838]|uniref:SWIM zinc finger domain-containing protein n=1 Tax=Nostoc flagelliforme FACHB-838 TaxID=2692904 RepID=A0ABR8E2P7_9NOSO|nr:SWIM zinc finger family protein [Nostoc flagelliforme]MBD2535683.1 SWIM zinc finger domain-containing protein [Nostoc flagelliforme FACHB-838]
MSIPEISEAIIRHNSNASSYSRGEEYYRRGAIADLKKRGNLIQAEVEGGEITPYQVSIRFDAGGITSASCTCPYDYDGWCKHIVATLLSCSRQSDRIEERSTLEQLLNRLDILQTQRLLQELVENRPELIDDIDEFVSLIDLPKPKTKQSSTRQSKIDTSPFRSHVKRILQDGLKELEYGSEEDPFTDDLLVVIEKARELAENGDGNNAIAILEAITETYAQEWDELLDYGGDSYSIVEPLDSAWTEAILCAEMSTGEIVDLQLMLESWQDEISADFSMSLEALRQGWDYEPLQEIMQGDDTAELWENERPSFADDLALIRLQILERQNRYTEYLNLALAEEMTLQYLTQLAALGRVESAMSAAKILMEKAEEGFALAKILREDGYLVEALEICIAGINLPGNCLYEFATWTSDLAQGLEDNATALTASIIAFKIRPSFRDYGKIQDYAGETWLTLKQDLLQTLRDQPDWGTREAQVDIFLHEGLTDDAIKTVERDTYYDSKLVHRVMDAAVSHRPDWVIDNACRRAEPIMEQGKADRYDAAVNWLKKVKAGYIELGKKAEWSAYRSKLEAAHGRKRKLMKLFKELN